MGNFLDQNLGNLSLSELKRLIRNEVARQIPAIPAGIADLSDTDEPLIIPDYSPDQGSVMVYDRPRDDWVPASVAQATDGQAPDSPVLASVQGGVGFFAVSWEPVVNTDSVEYEVHISTSSGFTPGPSTLYARIAGTLVFVRTEADGSTALVYGTTYYFKVIAVDGDGSSTASSEIGAQMVKAAATDLAVDSVTADQILAGSITAEKLAAVIVLANKFATSTSGARVEFDVQGIRLYDSSGNLSLDMDASSGSIALRGQVDFGRDADNPSRLSASDTIDLYEQPTTATMAGLVRSVFGSVDGPTSATGLTFPATTPGNLLIAGITIWGDAVSAPSIASVDAGWTLIQSTSDATNNMRLYTYKYENAPKKTTFGLSLSSSLSAGIVAMTVSEFSGVDITGTAEDVKTTNTGSATSSLSSGTTAATGTADEIVVATFSWVGDASTSAVGGFGGFGDENIGGYSVWEQVSSTGAQSESLTLDASITAYIGHIVTFVVSSSSTPPAADADHIRVYAKDVGGISQLSTMDENGLEAGVVMGTPDERWYITHHTVNVNIPNTAGDTAGQTDITISGVVSGDLVQFVGLASDTGASKFIIKTITVSTADTVTLLYYNSNPSSADPTAVDMEFLVWHRTPGWTP